MKAYAYMRCSGLGQGTDTWKRQREAIQTFCTAEGINDLAGVYQEDFVPGKLDREDRPAFQKMILDCTTNGVQIIVVERLDRLARRYRTQESLITYIAGEGLTLYAADTGENVTEAMMGDPMRRALVQIQGIFAELDKNMTIAKLRKARERLRVANGKCEGRKSFGNTPEEQEALDIILEMRRKEYSNEGIALMLRDLGYKTRYGKRWHGATIWKILHRHENCSRTASISQQLAELKR